MDSITRRRFLVASGVTAGLALATGAITVTFKELINAGREDPLPPPPSAPMPWPPCSAWASGRPGPAACWRAPPTTRPSW